MVERSCRRAWTITYWLLTAAFVGTAALNLLHIRGGFLTSYLADLTVPAWLYVIVRGLAGAGPLNALTRFIGAKPERAAISLFAASTATEISQIVWPRGFFAGRFDPLDIVAYGAGIAICYVADKWCGN
jgi:hypothetical protein